MHDPQKCELTAPFELHGHWWRSGSDPERAVSGCLSYTPDYGLQLQLYKDLPGEEFSWKPKEQPDQPIWGEVFSRSGKSTKASLLGEIQTNRPNDPSIEEVPASHTIFFINRAILGTHSVDPSALRVTSVQFSTTDLEAFANIHPVVVHPDGGGFKLEYTPPNPVEARIEDPSMTVKLATGWGLHSSTPDRSHTVTYRTCVQLSLTAPMPFDTAEDLVFSLTNLLLLCARESVDLRSIRAVTNAGESISSFGTMSRQNRRRRHWDWVLTLKDIEGHFEEVLNRWTVLVKKLGFVGHVFFSELNDPSPVQDARFLHFAGCLEAFHREIVQPDIGKFLPKAEYKQAMKPLLDQLPPTFSHELKTAIRAHVAHANDHAFGERITALFSSLEPEMQVCLADEPERFLTAIKHTRNKLAHIDEEDKGETFEGREYVHANLSLRAWLTILLLKECGIAESVIRSRMNAINYFYWGPFTFES